MEDEFPGFLNVDVDLASDKDLSKIATYLEKRDVSIHCAERITSPGFIYHEKYLITLEDEPCYRGQDSCRHPIVYLDNMVRILEDLRERFPQEFASLDIINFDLGFEETDKKPNTRFTIPSDTLKAITKLDGTITWTLYAASFHADDGPLPPVE